jgi:hypothetical protein
LPTTGNEHGRAFRDLELEKDLLELARGIGIGAQFGGKYFALDVRVIRLPRHGASLPVALVCEFYNLPPPIGAELPLADWMAAELRRPPVAGDSVALGSATLVVRELAEGRISRVGLGLPD